MIIKSLLLR